MAEHPWLDRIRGYASASLFAAYLLAFLPLTLGLGVYFTKWFVLQMVLGVMAVWVFPRDGSRRRLGA